MKKSVVFGAGRMGVAVAYAMDKFGHRVYMYDTNQEALDLARREVPDVITKLGSEKGYRLIGSNMPNTNAIFMRTDIGKNEFPEVSVEDCLNSEYALNQHKTKYPLIKDLPVEEV